MLPGDDAQQEIVLPAHVEPRLGGGRAVVVDGGVQGHVQVPHVVAEPGGLQGHLEGDAHREGPGEELDPLGDDPGHLARFLEEGGAEQGPGLVLVPGDLGRGAVDLGVEEVPGVFSGDP